MNILKKVIEYFSANPCGDGGSEKGFHEGNTCAKGGTAQGGGDADRLKAVRIKFARMDDVRIDPSGDGWKATKMDGSAYATFKSLKGAEALAADVRAKGLHGAPVDFFASVGEDDDAAYDDPDAGKIDRIVDESIESGDEILRGMGLTESLRRPRTRRVFQGFATPEGRSLIGDGNHEYYRHEDISQQFGETEESMIFRRNCIRFGRETDVFYAQIPAAATPQSFRKLKSVFSEMEAAPRLVRIEWQDDPTTTRGFEDVDITYNDFSMIDSMSDLRREIRMHKSGRKGAERFSLLRLIEHFAANPCGDGGASPGFQPGNTCASGGRPHDARRAGLLYHVEKSQPIKMSELRRRLGHPDLTPDNPVHAMVADLVKSGEITLSVVDGEPAASLGAKASPPAPGEFPTAFRKAFDAIDSRNGRTNFVKLHALRQALGVGRKEFDAGLRKLRAAGEFTMDSHEGLHGSLTPEEREAGIEEAGSKFIYVSRRSESFSMLRLVERFAAHPCGDGGGEQGFHDGNTCQKGGAGAGDSPAGAAKSTGKVLKKGAGGKFKIDLAKKGVGAKAKAKKAADKPSGSSNESKNKLSGGYSEGELGSLIDDASYAMKVAEKTGWAPDFNEFSKGDLKYILDNIKDFALVAGVDEKKLSQAVSDTLAKKGGGTSVAAPPAAEKAEQKDSPSSYDPNNIASIRKWGRAHFTKWVKSLKPDERSAVENYGNNGYKQMNATMRGFVYPDGVGDSYEDVSKMITTLNGALYRGSAPQDMQVVRGYSGPPSVIFGLDPGEVLPGATIRDPAFMSTTLKGRPPGIAQGTTGKGSDETVVKITLPKGTPGAYIAVGSEHDLDVIDDEHEFLMPAGYGHLRISSYERDSSGRHILNAVMVPNDDRTLKIPTRAESKLNAPPSKPHETPDSEYGSYEEEGPGHDAKWGAGEDDEVFDYASEMSNMNAAMAKAEADDKYNNDYLGYDADHPKAKAAKNPE